MGSQPFSGLSFTAILRPLAKLGLTVYPDPLLPSSLFPPPWSDFLPSSVLCLFSECQQPQLGVFLKRVRRFRTTSNVVSRSPAWRPPCLVRAADGCQTCLQIFLACQTYYFPSIPEVTWAGAHLDGLPGLVMLSNLPPVSSRAVCRFSRDRKRKML